MFEDQGFQMAFGRGSTRLARDLDNSALAAELEMSQSYLGLQKAARQVLKTEARKSLRKMGFAQPGSGRSYWKALHVLSPQWDSFHTAKVQLNLQQSWRAMEVPPSDKRQLKWQPGRSTRRNISMIRIVEAEAEGGKLYSVDNRRLRVFRLLEMTGKTQNCEGGSSCHERPTQKGVEGKVFNTDRWLNHWTCLDGNGQIGTTRSKTTLSLTYHPHIPSLRAPACRSKTLSLKMKLDQLRNAHGLHENDKGEAVKWMVWWFLPCLLGWRCSWKRWEKWCERERFR